MSTKPPFRNGPNRKRKRAELRERRFREQDGRCHLCGEPMTLVRSGKSSGKRFASFDHEVPKSSGGTAHPSNLKLAHRACNSARNDRTANAPSPEMLT